MSNMITKTRKIFKDGRLVKTETYKVEVKEPSENEIALEAIKEKLTPEEKTAAKARLMSK
jgi:hypothetical protein